MLSQRGAADAVQKMLAVVQVKATCERDGKPVEIQTEAVVPGDIILLHAGDSVDPESVTRPRRWDIKFVRRFMIVFGLANSACDYLTFGVLLLLMHVSTSQFRTGWFVENVVTASLIVLVIRTRKRFYQSRPSTPLLPYAPLALLLSFVPLPLMFLSVLAGIMIFYVTVAETAKTILYRGMSQ